MYRCCEWGMGNVVRCLLEAQVSPDIKTEEAYASAPMVCVAARAGATPSLKALLAGGANADPSDKCGINALMWSAREGHLSCLQLLLDAGANANVQDSTGNTPLHIAVMHRREECARALLPASMVNMTNQMGGTALHAAVAAASEACVQLLLPSCDVDVRTVPASNWIFYSQVSDRLSRHSDLTALHVACNVGQASICKALLSCGANRMARNSAGWTTLHNAAQGGHLSCVVLLVGRPGKFRMTPAEVDAVTASGWTAMLMAAACGYEQICGVLLEAGARLDAISRGVTPLMTAQHYQPNNATLLSLLSGGDPAQLLSLTCDHCGKTSEEASVKKLKTCCDCSVARYCSKKCQLASWPGHKAACKARVKKREELTRAVETSTRPPSAEHMPAP
jgi:ankyrin repeat protein